MFQIQSWLAETGEWEPIESPIFGGSDNEEFAQALVRCGYDPCAMTHIGEEQDANYMSLYGPDHSSPTPKLPYLVDFMTSSQAQQFFFLSYREAMRFFVDHAPIFTAIALSEIASSSALSR
jgi:hypothetical protein